MLYPMYSRIDLRRCDAYANCGEPSTKLGTQRRGVCAVSVNCQTLRSTIKTWISSRSDRVDMIEPGSLIDPYLEM